MSVRLNGTAISDRAVIFHHEVENTAQNRNLVCQSNTSVVSWHYPNGTAVGPFIGGSENDDYLQFQLTPNARDVFLIRNIDPVDIDNGLWTCRLGEEFVPVGIYQKGGKCYCCVLLASEWKLKKLISYLA